MCYFGPLQYFEGWVQSETKTEVSCSKAKHWEEHQAKDQEQTKERYWQIQPMKVRVCAGYVNISGWCFKWAFPTLYFRFTLCPRDRCFSIVVQASLALLLWTRALGSVVATSGFKRPINLCTDTVVAVPISGNLARWIRGGSVLLLMWQELRWRS